MISLREVVDKFGTLSHDVLATVEGTRPRLRPVTLARHGASFFFATGSDAARAQPGEWTSIKIEAK